MASYTPVSFTSPGFDYGTDLAAIERRRAMAQALQQQGMQPIEQSPVGAGQFATRISPFQGAAKMAQIVAAGMQQKKADEQQKELAQRSRSDLASLLMNAQKAAAGTPGTALSEDASGNVTPAQPAVAGDPSKAAALYMQHPQTAQLGMQMTAQDQARQRRQQEMAQLMQGARDSGATAGGPWSPQYAGQQAAQGNPMAGMNPQVLAAMLSDDPSIAKLGSHLATRGETSGRPITGDDGRLWTASKSGGLIPLMDENGKQLRAREKNESVTLGGYTQFVNPYSPPTGPMVHTIPPGQRAELAFKGALPPEVPSPAPRPTPSPSAAPATAPSQARPVIETAPPEQRIKLEQEKPQAGFAVRTVQDGMDRIGSQIDKLLTNREGVSGVTGPIAGRVGSVKGKSVNAQADLDSLKSMMSVRELQNMRDASKTGGAVGNVTEKEWPRLEAQWAALQQTQTTDEFRTKLSELRNTVRRMQASSRKAYEETYGKLDHTPATQDRDPLGIR